MKKLLIFTLVVAMASLASATTVSIVAPAAGAPGSVADPLTAAETLRVYLGVDAQDLDSLSVTISATNATIDGGILASEAPNYGAWAIDLGTMILNQGGWQPGLSNDTTVVLGAANIGLGQFGNIIYTTVIPVDAPPLAPLGGGSAGTPIAYIDITAAGTGDIVLSIINGSQHGSSSILTDLTTVPDLAGATINAVPEPATMLILGLGALLLRRRK